MDKFVTKRPRLLVEGTSSKSTAAISKEPKDTKLKNKSTKYMKVSSCSVVNSSALENTEGRKTDESEKQGAKQKADDPGSKTRVFKDAWRVGRPWLQYNGKTMWCQYCRDAEKNIKPLLRSDNMIKGISNGFKVYTVTSHEESKAHELAVEIYTNTKVQPENAPARHIATKMNKNNITKLVHLFRNVHALAKNHQSLRNYVWLCQLDEMKGVDIGTSYRSPMAAMRFLAAIASHELSYFLRVWRLMIRQKQLASGAAKPQGDRDIRKYQWRKMTRVMMGLRTVMKMKP